MANLQESARQLVEQIGEMDGDVETAISKLNQLRERLKTLEKDLDDRIDDLVEEVDEFVGKVREETGRLGGEIDEADQALTAAQQAVDGARTAAESAIDAGTQAGQAVAGAVQQVPEELEKIVAAQAEGAASALGEQARATATAVDQAIEATSANVTAFTESLVELQQKIPEAAEGMGAAIKKTDEHLGEAFVEWTSKLFEVVDLVKNEGFKPAQSNAEDVAEYALEQCKEGLEEALQPALDRMAELARDFEALQRAIDEAASQVTEEGERPVVSEMAELQDALTTAMGWLEKVETQLGKYSFMKG